MKVITIGRSNEGNDVIINDDPMVSRHHFQIVQDDDGSFRLADFGSTNGTYINGQKVSGEVELGENDIVRVGNTTIPWRQYFDSEFGGYVETKQPVSNLHQTSNKTLVEKQRHGFVTFWLVLMIIANIAGAIMQMLSANYAIWQYATEEKAKLFFYVEHGMVDYYTYAVYFMVVLSIINVVGASLILNWKKVGYWLFLGSASACLVIMISFAILGGVSNTVFSSMLGAVLGPVVLWAILQIKKDGVSCWELLE